MLAALSIAVKVQTSRLETSKQETVAVQAAFDLFKEKVKQLGEKQNAEAAAQKLTDEERERKANAENAKTSSALVIALDSLRKLTPDPRGRELPAPSPASSRPDLLCLDRAEYQRTDGEAVARLFAGTRVLADEGSKSTIDLNTAKKWAQEK